MVRSDEQLQNPAHMFVQCTNMYRIARTCTELHELVQLVISKYERSGNQKMECTLEETEVVVLFNESAVLNLYKHVHELVHVRANMYTTLGLWIY